MNTSLPMPTGKPSHSELLVLSLARHRDAVDNWDRLNNPQRRALMNALAGFLRDLDAIGVPR